MDISLQKITERRVNIDTFLPRALVMHSYRMKGVEKILTVNERTKIRSLCHVHPILIKESLEQNAQ